MQNKYLNVFENTEFCDENAIFSRKINDRVHSYLGASMIQIGMRGFSRPNCLQLQKIKIKNTAKVIQKCQEHDPTPYTSFKSIKRYSKSTQYIRSIDFDKQMHILHANLKFCAKDCLCFYLGHSKFLLGQRAFFFWKTKMLSDLSQDRYIFKLIFIVLSMIYSFWQKNNRFCHMIFHTYFNFSIITGKMY